MRRRLLPIAVVVALLAACSDGSDDGEAGGPSAAELTRQGGEATVDVSGAGAFAQPVSGLDGEQRRTFAVGNNFFNDNWVTAPASTTGRDGLGPLFNAQSCSSCHFRDGRGRPPESADDPVRGLLIRLSQRGPDGELGPHPALGDQLQDRAIHGVPEEGSVVITSVERPGRYADGSSFSLLEPTYEVRDAAGQPLGLELLVSPRVAPAMFGVGLLEAVPRDEVVAHEDPDDGDDDGISGRAHLVPDPATGEPTLGRFGWKAAVATVRDQDARAFGGDIGISSSDHPGQPCTTTQTECAEAPDGGEPEVDDRKLEQVTFYARTLAVPARRDAGSWESSAGQATFERIGCSSCHLPVLHTGAADIAALDHQTIRPYTDLLLHDMGPALADDRPDGDAGGAEWRTAPLWGIGLVETVNGHTRFLHDGRARNLAEAVLWHGGEAREARDRFVRLPAKDRAAVLTFLESL